MAVVQAWDAPLPRALADWLLLAATFLLPLSAAGTIELGFTITISYVLGGVAAVVGFPSVIRGSLRLPRWLLCAAFGLLAVYAIGVVMGSDLGLSSSTGRSRFRDVVYFLDLALGLAIMALMVDFVGRRRTPRPLMACLSAGAAVAATYAAYQWLAQHYGWPLRDVVNALNSDGVTTGDRDQGPGLLGWERVRGTFKEPLLLASYLALSLPVTVVLAVSADRRAKLAWTACAVVITLTLVLTVSLVAWAALFLATLVVASIWAVQRGKPRMAGILGAACAMALAVGPTVFVDPSALSTVTGRSKETLRLTSGNRTEAWARAAVVWSERPMHGFGPGQSAVRLAYRPDLGPAVDAPITFGSAQGLWAAALIDGGLVALFAWTALLASAALFVGRSLLLRNDPLLLGCAVGGLVAAIVSQLSGDRLDLRVWFAWGLVLAAASLMSQQQPRDRSECPD